MKTSKILLGTTIVGIAFMFSGCDNKEELTGEENRYVHVGENWGKLSSMSSTKGHEIKVYSKSQKYKIGKEMSFEVISKQDGLLYVVYTSQKDKSMLVYPNSLSSDNSIKAHKTFILPPKEDQWKMQASAPEGKSLLTFFVFPNESMANNKLKKYASMPITEKALTLIKDEKFGVESVTVEVVK